jgi:endonuclease-8
VHPVVPTTNAIAATAQPARIIAAIRMKKILFTQKIKTLDMSIPKRRPTAFDACHLATRPNGLATSRSSPVPSPSMEGPHTRALAAHLNDTLTGIPVERILVPEHRWQANMLLLNCVGQVIQRVRSHGKWLFLDFSHGVTWLCQLITRAKWNILSEEDATRFLATVESPPDPEKKSPRRPLIALILKPRNAPRIVATLTGRPIFYILPTANVYAHPEIKALGPDPIGSPSFHDDFPYRLRQNPNRTVAAALLDQETIAGLGNMLKCEILFAVRFSPAVRISTLLASHIDRLASSTVALVATATEFAIKGQPFPHRVFDRAGLPCTLCSTEILADRSGQDAHLTWYCPTCQPLGREPTLFP